MSLYLYAPKLYAGTRELIDALQAKRLVKHDGMNYLHKGVPVEFGPKDAIVCWGAHAPAIPNVRCLNASYEYPTMLDINLRGVNKLSGLGYSVFALTRVTDAEYRKRLSPTPETWWPKKHDSNLVGLHEFEGYCQSYYGFGTVGKTTIFCGQYLDGDPDQVSHMVKLADCLKLDFATFYFGKSGASCYILKTLTAPALDAEGVKLFADKILAWRG